MNLDLKGKHAIVCGSTQGIGKAVAMELADLGATIILVARDEDALKKIQNELSTKAGQHHDHIHADFSFPAELQRTLERYLELKKVNINILVNNTGGPKGGPVADAKTDEFIQTFSNHVICNHILAQAVMEGMKKSGYGRIINIISTSVKQPIKGLGVSNTVRGAVASWSKTLAGELAPFGITVNNVLPGATNTIRLKSLIETKVKKTGQKLEEVEQEWLNEIPVGRFAEPNEIAQAVAFLASPAAAYINGVSLPVDGGRLLCL